MWGPILDAGDTEMNKFLKLPLLSFIFLHLGVCVHARLCVRIYGD